MEVIDKNEKTIQGYEKENGVILKSDSVEQNIRWHNRSLLPNDMPYRLLFHLKNGYLYSYHVEKSKQHIFAFSRPYG